VDEGQRSAGVKNPLWRSPRDLRSVNLSASIDQRERLFVGPPLAPAIESVTKLQREFPNRRIQLVVSPKILGANMKVSNLAQMMAEARYDYLIVNDSVIRGFRRARQVQRSTNELIVFLRQFIHSAPRIIYKWLGSINVVLYIRCQSSNAVLVENQSEKSMEPNL